MFSKAGKLHDDLKKRQVDDTLDGKNAFQCFWSDPKTRVFECFWVSLCILDVDGKIVFQCFWSNPKTRVFEYCFSEVMYCFCHLG